MSGGSYQLIPSCVKLKNMLKQEGLSENDRQKIQAILDDHIGAAVSQRRSMRTAVYKLTQEWDEDVELANLMIPLYLDEEEPAEHVAYNPVPKVLVQAEDFGGGIPLPFFGYQRPATDYFNSNLTLHNFNICDINKNENHCLFFDERGQGKGADCMCSMRLRYHLQQRSKYDNQLPKTSLSILDNCVGQNKSNVVMKFFVFLSSTRHFYTGWENVLNMYITNMPACYTDYFYFEFQDGFVTYRHKCDTPDNEATRVNLLRNGITAEDARTRLLQLVFGRQYTDPQQLDVTLMDNLNIPRCEVTTLSATKVKSLSEKYFSIPAQYLPYYPTPSADDVQQVAEVPADQPAQAQPVPVAAKRKRPLEETVAGAKKPGPKKKVNSLPINQSSILCFMNR